MRVMPHESISTGAPTPADETHLVMTVHGIVRRRMERVGELLSCSVYVDSGLPEQSRPTATAYLFAGGVLHPLGLFAHFTAGITAKLLSNEGAKNERTFLRMQRAMFEQSRRAGRALPGDANLTAYFRTLADRI